MLGTVTIHNSDRSVETVSYGEYCLRENTKKQKSVNLQVEYHENAIADLMELIDKYPLNRKAFTEAIGSISVMIAENRVELVRLKREEARLLREQESKTGAFQPPPAKLNNIR
jgi:hypothetical protein